MKSILPLLLLSLISSTYAAESKAENKEKPKTVEVTVAQLLDEPAKYSSKSVSITGYWIRGFEWSYFSESEGGTTSDIWVGNFLAPARSPIEAQLKSAYVATGMEWPRGNIRVSITCEGLFEYRDFKFDETKMGSGFGHLGHYHSQISISKITTIKVLPDLEFAGPR